MNLLVLSDTHLGKPGWNGFGELTFTKAAEMARHTPIDVVLHCGDIAEPYSGNTIESALESLTSIRAKKHLWVAGNNDIEHLGSMHDIMRYHEILHCEARAAGVDLLDNGPVRLDDVVFVGGFGCHDRSLWRTPAVSSPAYPSDKAKLDKEANDFHFQMTGVTADDFFRSCQKRLHQHVSEAIRVKDSALFSSTQHKACKIVIATHTAPHSEMVVYGASPAYDFKNAFMGWDDKDRLGRTPGLVAQFCGHTHRSKQVNRLGMPPLINVSGKEQPFLFTI